MEPHKILLQQISLIQLTAAGPTPTITLGTTSGTYSANVGATSGVQTSTVTGANLTANISVTAPAYYEVSSDGGTTWGFSYICTIWRKC
jgi:hypothetical protein